jgi:DNA uptake protein ComE-like DNA-binding protein
MKFQHTVRTVVFSAAALLVVGALAASAAQQKPADADALVDLNTASEKEVAALPHMTPAIAKDLIAKRPFTSITAVNTYLLGQKLTQAQATELYGKAFVRVNLNKGTEAEFMLIPGAGKRMAGEFEEYRPWKTKAQFEKEIGKYVNAAEVARLWKYVVIE